jgi:superfamily I DNA/RNA helicase
MLFLADDPSQSIYRNFSWREKSVEVVGRTRWLRVPYRNTFEIYKAAYGLIANNSEIQDSLKEQGELIKPDFTSQEMRHGNRPLFQKFSNTRDELARIKVLIDLLKTDGYREEQIAVLTKIKKDLEPIRNVLKGSNVLLHLIYSFKGLEMEAVILPHIHRTFIDPEEEASERRLMYMAMTRARSRLYLTYSGTLPEPFDDLRSQNLADFRG